MLFDIFPMTCSRTVQLCGTNYYPVPEYHLDRIMQEHDLMYICEGNWQVAQDQEIFDLKAGDVILLRAGSHHWGTSLCPVGSRNMFIHFNRESTDRLKVELSGAEAHMYASGSSLCVPTLVHCGLNNRVSELFCEVVEVYWGHRDDKERYLSILLNMILNELSSIARNSQPRAESWITALLDQMNRHPDRIFSLAEAADVAGMNVRTFSARFRKMTGKSFHEYQMDKKMELAYDTLRSGGVSVKETAARCGFSDPYYFSRLFRQKFRASPSEIRKGDPSANVNRPQMK